nr:uncharacterized protein LOC113702817 [Coffea arabica]
MHVDDGAVIEDPTYPSDEYRQWYRKRTVLYISNPTRHPVFPEDFQGDSARAQYLMDAMSQVYYMAKDSLAHSDEQHSNYFNAMKDFASITLNHVGESSRLAFRPPRVPRAIPQPADPWRVQRASRNIHGGQHGGDRRRRYRSLEPTVQIGLDEGSQATEHHGTSTSIGHTRSPVPFGELTADTDVYLSTSAQYGRDDGEGQRTQAVDARLDS